MTARKLFISRHEGAIDWLRETVEGAEQAEIHEHLSKETLGGLKHGDAVYGILPIRLTLELTRRLVDFHLIDVPLSSEDRRSMGELSKAEMTARGATLKDVIVLEGKRKLLETTSQSASAPAVSDPVKKNKRSPSTVFLKFFKDLGRLAFIWISGALVLLVGKDILTLGTAAFDYGFCLSGQSNPFVDAGTKPRLLTERQIRWYLIRIFGIASILAYLKPWLTRVFKDFAFSFRTYSKILQPGEGREGLIIFLSTISFTRPKFKQFEALVEDLSLEAICDADPASAVNKLRFPWQQPFRLFRSSLKKDRDLRVVVIGSSGDNGSYKDTQLFIDLADRALKRWKEGNVTFHKYGGKVDFDNIQSCEDAIKGAIKLLKEEHNLRTNKISIDITGGKAITSKATALMAINTHCDNVYVDTESCEVIQYNTKASMKDI